MRGLKVRVDTKTEPYVVAALVYLAVGDLGVDPEEAGSKAWLTTPTD